MKKENTNKKPKTLYIAGLAINNVTARLILDGIDVRLNTLLKEEEGIVGLIIDTKSSTTLTNLWISDNMLPMFLQLDKKEKEQIYLTMSKIIKSDYALLVFNESIKKDKIKDDNERYYRVKQVLIDNLDDYVDEWNRHLEFLLMNSIASNINKYDNYQQ